MPVLGNIKQHKAFIFVTVLAGIILLVILSILFIDRRNNPSNASLNQVNTQYKQSLSSLEDKLNALAKENNQTKSATFQKAMASLDKLKQENLSDKDKYTALQNTMEYYIHWYRNNNIHAVYTNSYLIGDFAKEYFLSYYKKDDFAINCQDPKCATVPQPAEIDKIIADIKASDFPAEVKESTIIDIQDDGYFQHADDRARNYLESADIIKGYDYYSPNKTNRKIADELIAFVKDKYPNEYIKYQSDIKQ